MSTPGQHTHSAVEHIKPYGADDPRAKESQVEAMFDSIAPAYDMMNRMMTLGIDRRWRKLTSAVVRRVVSSCQNPCVLDVATGTGDLLLQMAHDMEHARFVGVDLSAGMLARGEAKLTEAGLRPEQFRLIQADSLNLPFDDGAFDAVTVAFGVRNFADISRGLRELRRVLKPGGILCILELSTPTLRPVRPFYNLYTRCIIPAVGRLMSHDRSAYSYLPASIAAVPQGREMLRLMEEAGLKRVAARPLTLGVCTLYTGTVKSE